MRRLLPIALLCLGSVAQAHEGHAHSRLSSLLSRWTWDPLIWALVLVSSGLYALGLVRLRRRAGGGLAVKRWEVASFAVGLSTIVIALLSPIDALSDVLFSAHMTQHELLMLVAAPLLALGKPLLVFLWAFSPRARSAIGAWTQRPGISATWRAISGPVTILIAHAIALWVWHVPALFEAALRSEWVHATQHALFFFTAAIFWWALIHGRYGRAGYGVAVAFVFVTATHSTILGAMITFANRLWYPAYQAPAREYAVNALEDQRLAGLIMWVPAGVILMLAGLGLFLAWLGEARRRVEHSRSDGLLREPPGASR